ncbi:MAG: DUF3592 domain-containing protein [Algicola sp.]|nr:DUF3592 domain-containing protein [Algicola sp.]
MKKIIGLGILLFGVLVLLWTAWKLFDQQRYLVKVLSVTGVITGYEYSDGSRIQRRQDSQSGVAGRVDVAQASPVIEFKTLEGKLITFTSSTTIDLSASYSVPLVYLPANPTEAQIDDFFSLWGWIFVIGGFACIFIFIGSMLRWVF